MLTGKQNASAIWATQRLPADHVAAVGNSFTIRSLNLKDSENSLYSKGVTAAWTRSGGSGRVFWAETVPVSEQSQRSLVGVDTEELAEEMGWWKASDAKFDGDFDFFGAYGYQPYDYNTPPGQAPNECRRLMIVRWTA